MSAICIECEAELTYDGDCESCEVRELRKRVKALEETLHCCCVWRCAPECGAHQMNPWLDCICQGET